MSQGFAYNANTDTRTIQKVRLVAHSARVIENMSENHWSIYLCLPGRESVRLNMTADPGYITGDLKITSHNYDETISQIKMWDFLAVPNLQVRHVVNYITSPQMNRQNYDMSGGGSGCRWWVFTILRDLGGKSWINGNKVEEIYPQLLLLYHKVNEPVRLDMVQGEFV